MAVIAVGQFSAVVDTDANVAVIGDFAHRALQAGAKLLVLPEYAASTPPTFDNRILEVAEPLDGRFVTALSGLARRHGLALVAGMVESSQQAAAGAADPGQRVANTVVGVGADGSLQLAYRKVHLFDALGVQESTWIEPGQPGVPATMTVDGLCVGVQTCYDLRFPESTRVLADGGADVVVVAAQWLPGPHKVEQWRTLLAARAIENSVYVVGAGQTLPTGVGHSVILDPMGLGVVELADEPGVGVGLVGSDRIAEVRKANPVLDARRYRVVPDA